MPPTSGPSHCAQGLLAQGPIYNAGRCFCRSAGLRENCWIVYRLYTDWTVYLFILEHTDMGWG